MGSIPAGSTKKRRMQFCIRRFLVFLLVNRPSVRQYGLPYSCRGTPAGGKRQIPVEKKTCSHFFEMLFNAKTTFLRIGNKVTVNFERYRRIAMPHIFAHGLNRNVLR